MKFIGDCLESIMKQTVWVKEEFDIKIAINVVDNGSQDGTLEFIKKEYPFVHILKNINNLGFCRANNQAIRMHNTEWVLIINPDVILEPDFLEKLLTAAQKSKEDVGALASKILRIETQVENGGLTRVVKTNKIDSYGLEVKKSRQVKNIGEGEDDEGQYDEVSEVFGFAGTCVLLRRDALEDIAFREEYLDEDFFAYQDDYDLAYRLQLYGWRAKFVPRAVAYHFRSAQATDLSIGKLFKIIRARRQKSRQINYHSYKNHLFVLFKNEINENFWRHFFPILWFEFKKFIYVLLFEQKTLGALGQVFKKFKTMRLKRKIILGRRKVTAEYMRQWFK